jgi:phage repressor protein C with HTH and peptisase S24 domain
MSKKSTIKQNILQYVDYLGITKYTFYKNTGITRGVLDQDTGMSEENIARFLAQYPDVNPDWLIFGSGEMLKTKSTKFLTIEKGQEKVQEKGSKRKVQKTLPFNDEMVTSDIGIPYYEDLHVAAGDIPAVFSNAKPTSYINLPQIKDCQAVLPVMGGSMKGVVESGDLIAIKEIKSRNEFDPSLPYLIITDEHRMIKYLRVDEDDENIIWAESTNHSRIRLHVDNIKMVYAIKCIIRCF